MEQIKNKNKFTKLYSTYLIINKKRGSLLLLSLFILIVITFMVGILFKLFPPVQYNFSKIYQITQLKNIAFSDTNLTLTLLKAGVNDKNNLLYYFSSWTQDTPSPGITRYRKTFNHSNYISKITLTNILNTSNTFKITTKTYTTSNPNKYVKLTTVYNFESFSKYAAFDSNFPAGIYWGLGEQVSGPYHTNTNIRVECNPGSGDPPRFTSLVSAPVGSDPNATIINSSAVDNIVKYTEFIGTTPINVDGSTNISQLKTVFKNGLTAWDKKNAKTLKLPPNNTNTLISNALNGIDPSNSTALSTALVPNTSEIYIPHDSSNNITNGGIYIQGNVDSMELRLNNPSDASYGSDNQVINLKTSSNNYTIVEVKENNCTAHSGTTITPPAIYLYNTDTGTESILYGKTNGLIFVDGNINSLKGKTKGRKTIAVNTDNNNYIKITDNLQYNDKNKDSLGLICKDLIIPRYKDDGTTEIVNINIDASILAFNDQGTTSISDDTGGLIVQNLSSRTLGDIYINGGIISGYPQATWNGFNGLREHINYDKRFFVSPPPFFPLTGTPKIIYIKLEYKGFGGI